MCSSDEMGRRYVRLSTPRSKIWCSWSAGDAVVKPSDHIYHLGDVCMRKEFLWLIGKLSGHKRLVRGNHDIFPTKEYLRYFEEIHGVRVFEGLVLSHIPLHPESVKPIWTNIHGHLHAEEVMLGDKPDTRYLNVAVEHTNYTPISLEDVRKRVAARRALLEATQ